MRFPAVFLIFLAPSVFLHAAKPPLPTFEKDVRPILLRRCGTCHGEAAQESQIRFDHLSEDFSNRATAQTWREARNAINAGEMPPEDEPPLTAAERQVIDTWIRQQLQLEIERSRSTSGRVVMRRLNRREYQNTMYDLLGLEMDYTRDLPPDAVSPDGYRNNGQSLRLSAIQLEYYLETARQALQRVIVSTPPPRVFRHRFTSSNVGGWRGPTEFSNRLERAQKFLVKMVDDYPEAGEFRVRIRTRAELKTAKGYPILECAVGYRPDTEVHFRIAGTREVTTEDLQQIEFRGRLENFPLPVRGQGKYPGLVVRLRNSYSDGSPAPSKLEKVTRDGKEVQAFPTEPELPNLQIESVEFEGPLYSQWPPQLHRNILFDSPLRREHESRYVREVLRRFMTRAFRRPVRKHEVMDMFVFFASIRPHFTRFEDAIRETLAMVLIQPDFLYQLEPAGEFKRGVTNSELACRLSYFLWSSMPDERLLQLADQGILKDGTVLQSETRRLLSSPRASEFFDQFTSQWLRLNGIDNVSVDQQKFPNFDDSMKPLLQRETTALFAELTRNNESGLRLLSADFTMLNEQLARHYGIPNVFGRSFRRHPLPENRRRGGILGHAGILLANSTGRESHPIRRAVWIRDRLLHDPPAPPPPDVPELDETNPEFAKLTISEQLKIHRKKESCNSCHRALDPWGLALENFDAIGHWRETSSEEDSGAGAQLPDGTMLTGFEELRDHLTEKRAHDFAEALTRNLFAYALGRGLELTDEPELEQIVADFVEHGYRLRSLIEAIVTSEAFLTK